MPPFLGLAQTGFFLGKEHIQWLSLEPTKLSHLGVAGNLAGWRVGAEKGHCCQPRRRGRVVGTK